MWVEFLTGDGNGEYLRYEWGCYDDAEGFYSTIYGEYEELYR